MNNWHTHKLNLAQSKKLKKEKQEAYLCNRTTSSSNNFIKLFVSPIMSDLADH